MNLNQVTLPAQNIEASNAFYEGMGFRKIVSTDTYTRFECPAGDATFSLDKVESKTSSPGAVIYFEVDNLSEVHADLVKKGYYFGTIPKAEEWLWTEARLRDPSGNLICLYTAGVNRRYPPWRLR
ncbi:MAG: VOC family protein [Gammaproteobacteria bacterium]|nr:VOC family protein [Gammaproteobacteria bacterium]